MKTWTPLWSGLVDSSIWEEPDHVFRVFMAMMCLKDHNHVVSLDSYKLARRIHMPVEKVLDALKVLASPDTRRPGQEFEGRRIQAVDDGWLMLNGEKYREQVKLEMRRARNRRSAATRREKERLAGKKPLPGESTYLKGQKTGDLPDDWTPQEFREEPVPYRAASI